MKKSIKKKFPPPHPSSPENKLIKKILIFYINYFCFIIIYGTSYIIFRISPHLILFLIGFPTKFILINYNNIIMVFCLESPKNLKIMKNFNKKYNVKMMSA